MISSAILVQADLDTGTGRDATERTKTVMACAPSYVCRFCGRDCESNNGFFSLEISMGNRKIILYVCGQCRFDLAGSRITRCRSCGNVWLKKNAGAGSDVWTVPGCSLCEERDVSAPGWIHRV